MGFQYSTGANGLLWSSVYSEESNQRERCYFTLDVFTFRDHFWSNYYQLKCHKWKQITVQGSGKSYKNSIWKLLHNEKLQKLNSYSLSTKPLTEQVNPQSQSISSYMGNKTVKCFTLADTRIPKFSGWNEDRQTQNRNKAHILTERITKLLHWKILKSRLGAGLTGISTGKSAALLNSKCNHTVELLLLAMHFTDLADIV